MIPVPQRHVLAWPESRVGMAFRLIPSGSFRMGSRGYSYDEEPIHRVEIAEEFWLGETPVTQAQFALWTQAKKIKHENGCGDHPDYPAENLDWRQAQAYCAWLTRTKGDQFPGGFGLACLPTEAEWEYACRAGTESEYYTGDGEAALAEAGWFDEDFEKGSTHPVRQKPCNAFHLYDLHGNVWDWCHDGWDESAYRIRLNGEIDPGSQQRLLDWSAGLKSMTKSEQSRVLRGGSWGNFFAWYCRSARRSRAGPGDRGRGYGFRVCLVRGLAAGRGALSERAAEPSLGYGRRGTRPESDGTGGAGANVPDLTTATLPRAAGREIS